MDKIWDRKSFRSRRSLAVVARMKKQMTTQNRQKSIAKDQQQESELSLYTNCTWCVSTPVLSPT